jgi:plastocyanin
VDPAGLLGFLFTGVGAGFEVLPVLVSGTTLTLQVTHFSTAGAAQGSLQDFAQQVQPLLDALPSTLPPTQVQNLVSLAIAWVERFGVPVCTGTDLCRRVFEIAQQSLAFHRTQACAQTFALIGQGEPFSARLALAPVLRLAAALVELAVLAGNLGLVGFEEPVDFACVEGALRGLINLATGQAVADPRDGLLQLLFDLSGDAALLGLEEVREAALAGLRSALTALLGFGEQLCQTDPDAGEALLARPGDLFGTVFLDALDADLAERIGLAQAGCRIRITPALATVGVGQQVQFTGTVVGLTPSSVTWSIEGPASGSTIDAQTGLFTAGNIDGVTVSVVATRLGDPTRFKRTSVTVCAAPLPQTGPTPARRLARAAGPIAQDGQCVGLAVTPASVTVAAGETVQFTASLVAGVPFTDVTWSVSGGGTISPTGLFTAGTTPGTFTVTATDLANPAVTGQAQVTISSEGLCAEIACQYAGTFTQSPEFTIRFNPTVSVILFPDFGTDGGTPGVLQFSCLVGTQGDFGTSAFNFTVSAGGGAFTGGFRTTGCATGTISGTLSAQNLTFTILVEFTSGERRTVSFEGTRVP